MELRVEEYQLPEELKFNFEELKTELAEKVKTYETMVYTDDQIKEAKTDRANLNKLKKALNDERIRREREYMEPFNQFKEKINDIISIIDKPIAVIDKQIKAADDKRKADKQLEIGSLFVVKRFPDWVRIDMIQDPSWLNATTSMKQIEDNLDGWKNRISEELKTIEGLQEFSFEATEVYKKTLDMAKAIAESQRLADIQKRKEEKMDKEKIIKEAEELARAMGCCIHVEMKDGKCEQIISGSGLALAIGLCKVIERIAKIIDADFEEVFGTIRQIHYSKQETDEEEE